MTTPSATGSHAYAGLRADCQSCAGLCCVALPFARSADFAINKAAGAPCPNLDAGHRCTIHAHLSARGFPGCVAFDCFGAGQQVTQVTFDGVSWRDRPELAGAIFVSFGAMRQVQEMRWYLADASTRRLRATLAARVASLGRRLAALAELTAERLGEVDLDAVRADVDPVLQEVSATVRAAVGQTAGRLDYRRADLVGARLAQEDLHGADLRGSLLLGADLRGADLRSADLLGADLRGADLRGADLRGALFVTSPQLAAAQGDAHTLVDAHLERPAGWTLDDAR